MGATTSILRAAEDHDLAACVLDSAFRDLRTVAEELVGRGRFPIPSFLVSWALELVRSEVATRAAFDPLELMPIKCAKLAVCPALFGVASDDTFVLPHHTQDLHDAWKGERSLRVFDGGHNGVRPTWFLEEAADFLAERLGSSWAAKSGKGFTAAGVQCISIGGCTVQASRHRAKSSHSQKDEDEDDSKDGIAAPRLVSPLTQRLEMDGQPEAFSQYESGPPDGRVAPSASDSPRGTASSSVEPKPRSTRNSPARPARESTPRSTPPPALPGGGRRVGPPGATLALQLQYLGFNEVECDMASKRCLTLEAAMEWLSEQRVTVHL